jgi:hypothetical protein
VGQRTPPGIFAVLQFKHSVALNSTGGRIPDRARKVRAIDSKAAPLASPAGGILDARDIFPACEKSVVTGAVPNCEVIASRSRSVFDRVITFAAQII